MTTSIETEADQKTKTVKVTFNRKTIGLPKGILTGMQIKLQAIAQGIQIQPSYVLFVVEDRAQRRIVGDLDTISIRAELVFAAVADDDNS